MKTLIVSALLLVACKSEKKEAAPEAPKPVETKAEDIRAEMEKVQPASNLPPVAPSDKRAPGSPPAVEAAGEELAKIVAGEDLGAIIDPTSTLGFADYTGAKPVLSDDCGGAAAKKAIEAMRKTIGDNSVCSEIGNNRVHCVAATTPKANFIYAYQLDAAVLVGFALGESPDLVAAMSTRGGKACGDAH